MNPPISVKGIVVIDGQVVLLRNERDEWELPGGRVEPGESERDALVREVNEELGLVVDVRSERIDRYEFSPVPGRVVTIVTYPCEVSDADSPMVVSDEHVGVAMFAPAAVARLPDLPPGYRRSILRHLAP